MAHVPVLVRSGSISWLGPRTRHETRSPAETGVDGRLNPIGGHFEDRNQLSLSLRFFSRDSGLADPGFDPFVAQGVGELLGLAAG